MMQNNINGKNTKPETIRCAIYTRKSTEEGLEQEYNTLDAQRDSCEAYIQSQKSRGWKIIPRRYDDGGFTGSNTKRPAYHLLIADIKADLVDVVIVYKVDRLSRSLTDFANIMTIFSKHNVGFVSVTQYFDTSSSIGRMTLNILITFSQFEREMICERIRDKISRSKKKGKYMGGQQVLGYDAVDKKLIINESEKYQIQRIYEFYSNGRSINDIVDMINNWGWTTKQWTTKKGKLVGGNKFNKQLLYTILKNPLYTGKIRYHDQIFDGEHKAIISIEQFDKVQATLKKNRVNLKNAKRKHTPSILRGILTCSSCGFKMIVIYTNNHFKKYTYYTCLNAVKNGRKKCPNKSIPTIKMDAFIVKHITTIATNPAFLNQFINEYSEKKNIALENISIEIKGLMFKLASFQTNKDNLGRDGNICSTDDTLQEHIKKITNRLDYLRKKKNTLKSSNFNAGEIKEILCQFFPIWDKLTTDEQCKVLQKLFERITWDSESESIDFHYSPLGTQLLQNEFLPEYES